MTTIPRIRAARAGAQPAPVVLGGALARGGRRSCRCASSALLGWATLIARRPARQRLGDDRCCAARCVRARSARRRCRRARGAPLAARRRCSRWRSPRCCARASPPRCCARALGRARRRHRRGPRARSPPSARPTAAATPWVDTTIMLGGTLLAGIAALQAFWPARDDALRSPVPAAMTLTTMFGDRRHRGPARTSRAARRAVRAAARRVPVRRPHRARADRRARRCSSRSRRSPAGGARAARSTPSRAVDRPADSSPRTSPTRGTVVYSWDHDYGPLEWPRDGRELLRIKARTVRLLEGRGARRLRRARVAAHAAAAAVRARRRDRQPATPTGSRRSRSACAGCAASSSCSRGQALDVDTRASDAVRLGGGTLRDRQRAAATRRRPTAPRSTRRTPSRRELRGAGTDYPSYAHDVADGRAPGQGRRAAARAPGQPPGRSSSRRSAADDARRSRATARRPRRARRRAARSRALALARAYALAQSLRAQPPGPVRLRQGRAARASSATASTPSSPPQQRDAARHVPVRRRTRGYCQHFSGAMALLLRMGGIPARVAVGFAPGRSTARRGEYVVRDFDAHSWVEAYFPQLGWVTFDPTPAAAPPRDQRRRPRARASRPARRAGDARGDVPANRAAAAAARTARCAWLLPPLAALVGAARRWPLVVVLRRRARRRPAGRAGARRARARAARQRPPGRARRRRSRDLERRLGGDAPTRAATCARSPRSASPPAATPPTRAPAPRDAPRARVGARARRARAGLVGAAAAAVRGACAAR